MTVGRQQRNTSPQAVTQGVGARVSRPRRRALSLLQICAFLAAAAMVLLVTVAPQQLTAIAAPEPVHHKLQALQIVGQFPAPASRDKYTVTRRIIVIAPPRAVLGPAVPASE